MSQKETIFDKIVRKEIPASIIYEDDQCLCFKDINPVAPFHALLIPKHKGRLERLSKATEEDAAVLGHLMLKAGEIARSNSLGENGFRIVVNDGQHGGQTVDHLHLHIIGGAQMYWPPGTGKPESHKL